MENKLKKATKRIAAVGAATVLVSSTAFGAGLSNYPTNFVKDGEFDGQVVVGAAAASIDTTSANSVIDDLRAEFSGESEKVKITYKEEGEGGDSVQILNSGDMHLLGESLGDNKDIPFDNRDFDVLEDSSIKLSGSTEDYTQEIEMGDNGVFEHSLRDRLEDDISKKLFFERDENIMSYTLDLDSSVSVDGEFEDSDIIGEKFDIMGQSFTVGGYSKDDSSDNFDELKLLGGANTLAIGEGESSSVTIDGEDYEVSIQSVATGTPNKVLLTVNSQSQSIDEFDSEKVGGVNIAVTDLVPSSRDSVKGYAEIVVGGQEVVLTHGDEVQVNDEEISDLFEDYEVDVYFSTDGNDDIDTDFNGFRLDYSHSESNGLILREGDTWDDKVFNAVGIKFNGINDVDYTETELSVSGDDLTLTGETVDGETFDREIAYAFEYGTDGAAMRLIGDTDYVPMIFEDVDFTGNAFTLQDMSNGDVAGVGAIDSETYYQVTDGSSVLFSGNGNEMNDVFVLKNNTDTATAVNVTGYDADFLQSGAFMFAGDEDNQYLYQVTGFSEEGADSEFSFEEIFADKTTSDVKHSDVSSKLVDISTFTYNNEEFAVTEVAADRSTEVDGLAFENQLMVDLASVNGVDINNGGSLISFNYDVGDMTTDSDSDANPFDVDLEYDIDDEVIELKVDTSGFESFGGKNDISVDNDDVKQRVDMYGTIVEYDTDDYDRVTISVPDEQVEADVSLVAGDTSASEMTVTVDADAVEDKKAELEEEGYTIVDEETITSEEVEFDVEGVTLDSDVEGTEDMIVVGGPAVNEVARELMGIEEYTIEEAGVAEGEGVVKYFEDSNSVLVYGYSGDDTAAAVTELNAGGLSGDEERI